MPPPYGVTPLPRPLRCDTEPRAPACSPRDVGQRRGWGLQGHNQLTIDPRSATLTSGSQKFPLLADLKYNWYLINYPYLKCAVESVLKNVYIHDTSSPIKMTNVSSAIPDAPARAGPLSVAGTICISGFPLAGSCNALVSVRFLSLRIMTWQFPCTVSLSIIAHSFLISESFSTD